MSSITFNMPSLAICKSSGLSLFALENDVYDKQELSVILEGGDITIFPIPKSLLGKKEIYSYINNICDDFESGNIDHYPERYKIHI